MVSLSYDEYKSMKSRIELLELLAEADEDVAYGRVSPIQDTFNDLRAMLKENKIYYCTYRYCRYWYSKKCNEYRKKFR